jgi:hypothetical protein
MATQVGRVDGWIELDGHAEGLCGLLGASASASASVVSVYGVW